MSDLGSRLRTTLQTFPWVTMGFPLGLRPLLPSHLVRKWGGGKPPVWGLLLIWDYPLPSLMEVIHRGNTDPALDQIIKTEISRKVLSPSLISRFYHLFMEPSPPGTRRGGGVFFCHSHISADFLYTWELFQQHSSHVCKGF